MHECPVCHATMEEIAVFVTECCGAEMDEEEEVCPACGAESPVVAEGEPQFACEICGHEE
jgi:hypothetical protein